MAVRLKVPPLPTIGDILRMYEIGARKQLAQNFLLDLNICRKIVRSAGDIHGGYVCEVGPGPAGITRAILDHHPKQLVVVEKDSRFFNGLQLLAEAYPDNMLKLEHGDILNYDVGSIWDKSVGNFWFDSIPNVHMIGNLPFNVATPLIIRWLRAMSERTGPFVYGRTGLTLTFQKEVGDRIVAPINGRARCRLSAMCQHLAEPALKFVIPGKLGAQPGLGTCQ